MNIVNEQISRGSKLDDTFALIKLTGYHLKWIMNIHFKHLMVIYTNLNITR